MPTFTLTGDLSRAQGLSYTEPPPSSFDSNHTKMDGGGGGGGGRNEGGDSDCPSGTSSEFPFPQPKHHGHEKEEEGKRRRRINGEIITNTASKT